MYRKVWLVWYGMGCRMYRYRMVHGMAWSGLMVSTNLLKLKFTTCKSRQLRCLRGKVHSFTWLPRWWWGGGWWLKIWRGCRLLQFWFHTFVICRTLQHWSSFHQYGKRWGRLRRAYGYWLYEKDEGVKYSSCFEGYWLWEKWGLRLKICKEGARKAPTAFHFSLTHGGGGSPFIFSYKLNHSLNQWWLEQNTLIRLKVLDLWSIEVWRPLQDPTCSWRPFEPLDFVPCARATQADKL